MMQRVPWSERQRASVVSKEFTKPKGFFAKGYDEIQVDDFLDRVASAMAAQQPLPDLRVTFGTPSGFGRSGYDPGQVDDFLDELRRMVPEG